MSKKVLILGIVVVLAVGGAAAYCWIAYSDAHEWLNRARQAVQTLSENIDRKDVNLNEMYRLADVRVYQLERYPSFWIGKDEVSPLRTKLATMKQELDQRAAAAEKKQNSGPHWGNIPVPASHFDKQNPTDRFQGSQFDTPIAPKSGEQGTPAKDKSQGKD